MTNSILLYFSCFRFNNKIKIPAAILCFINLLYVNSFAIFKEFLYVNIACYLIIFSISLIKRINSCVSSFSILIYSILVDTYCYFIHPIFPINISYFEYVLNGIIFNLRFCILPVIISLCVNIYIKFCLKRDNLYIKNFASGNQKIKRFYEGFLSDNLYKEIRLQKFKKRCNNIKNS